MKSEIKVVLLALLFSHFPLGVAAESEHLKHEHEHHEHDDEDHEHHHAHEHGAAKLDVAIEGSVLEISLSTPAMNILGFEHAAKSDADKAALKKAEATLSAGGSLFVFSPAAGCSLKQASVESALLGNSKDEADEGHADFDVSYQFECKSTQKLTDIQVKLFEQFPGTEHIRVSLVTAKGQSSQELDGQHAVVKLP